MLLTWHTLRDVIGARAKVDVTSADLLITGEAIRGAVRTKEGGMRPLALRLGTSERIGLRVLVAKLEKKLAPDHVDAVRLEIDWTFGTGAVTVFYQKSGEKRQHNETHTFNP